MSDALKHECGIAHIRLLKPLEYYKKKYGTAFYGINKMYLLMEKQHNRGQDGAGFASIKFDVDPGERYISRVRSIKQQPIQDVFSKINNRINEVLENNPCGVKTRFSICMQFGCTIVVFDIKLMVIFIITI